jgi:HSP20 family molecular chaperone IbpA
VPGLSRKNISIVVEDSQLVVTANREDRKRREDETEFKSTFLRRSFSLPEDVDEKSISASCSHGLLRISMKRKRKEGRRITVGEAKKVRPSGLLNGLTKRMKNFLKKIRAGE